MRTVLPVLFFALCASAADGGSFEVASVKPADPPTREDGIGCTGGPGTSSPGTWTCRHILLSQLVFDAYELDRYQLQPPAWTTTTWLAVAAKVPAGTTKEEFRKMQQNLLDERFKLALHREPKPATVYEVVVARSGLKMRESAPADAAAAAVEFSVVPHHTLDKDKFPVFPDGASGLMGTNNRLRWRSSNVTMADIVKVLKREVRSDVIDATGLKGRYDVDMYWQKPSLEIFASSPPFEGPALEKALQDQLGLKLESKKGTVVVVVIDHIEKTPVEN